MALSIIWSTRAFTEYEHLIDYLLEEWNPDIALRVTRELDGIINRIQTTPLQFPVLVEGKNIRRAVMSPQTSIFFRVNNDHIEIISLFDNRQNPQSRKL